MNAEVKRQEKIDIVEERDFRRGTLCYKTRVQIDFG